MTAEPPYGDFLPDEPGVFDAEDDEEEGQTEQGHTPPSTSPQGEGKTPAGHEDARVEPPPGQPAPQSPSAEQRSGEEGEILPPPIAVEDEADESMLMTDFEDLVGKRWGFSSTKRARR